MEYREFFDKALSEAFDNRPFPDDSTVLKSIRERADRMNKHNKIMHRVFTAAAGTAAAVAVVGGGIIGAQWLNEHGGLKERVSDGTSGAGFSASAVTSYETPETGYTAVKETPIDEETVFEFEDMTVRPLNYSYDGLSIKLEYEVTFKDGVVPGKVDDEVIFRADDGSVISMDDTKLILKDGDTATLQWTHTGGKFNRSCEIVCWTRREQKDYLDVIAPNAFRMAIELPEDKTYISEDCDSDIRLNDNASIKLKHFDICKDTCCFIYDEDSVLAVYEDNANDLGNIRIALQFSDGSTQRLTDGGGSIIGDNAGFCVIYNTEVIEPAAVESISVNGKIVYLNSTPEQIAEPYTVMVDRDFEYENCTVHVAHYIYDGLVLKMYYNIEKKGDGELPDIRPTIMGMSELYAEGDTVSYIISEDMSWAAYETVLYKFRCSPEMRVFFYNYSDPAESRAMLEDDKNILTVTLPGNDSAPVTRSVGVRNPLTFDNGITAAQTSSVISANAVSLGFERGDIRDPRMLTSELETSEIRIETSEGSISPVIRCSFEDLVGQPPMIYVLAEFDKAIAPENVKSIYMNDVCVYDSDGPKETSIKIVQASQDENSDLGSFKFMYYIDGEIQKDLTETLDLSVQPLVDWRISGTGVHKYKVLVKSIENGAIGTLFECTVDFTKQEPEKDFGDNINLLVFSELREMDVSMSQIAGMYAPGEELPYEVLPPDENEVTEDPFADLPEPFKNFKFIGCDMVYGDTALDILNGNAIREYTFPVDEQYKEKLEYNGVFYIPTGESVPVYAPFDGTVVWTGYYNAYGNTAIIRSEDGEYWLLGHLGRNSVEKGDTVKAGDIIGKTGMSGVSTRNELGITILFDDDSPILNLLNIPQ